MAIWIKCTNAAEARDEWVNFTEARRIHQTASGNTRILFDADDNNYVDVSESPSHLLFAIRQANEQHG